MRFAIVQTGAPTAVVNRSIRGYLDSMAGENVIFGVGGPDGLVERSFSSVSSDPQDLLRPGSLIGSGRRSVTSGDLTIICDNLLAENIKGLALIGGNGTMSLTAALAQEARTRNLPLSFVGIPKTIDNDLAVIDHSPGFASASRFLSQSITDISRDHEAMAGVEQVRIVETMGRDTGWLALAATYHRHDPAFKADLVLIPEIGFEEQWLLEEVETTLHNRGRALIVTSEGVAPHLTNQPVKERNHTQLIQGGLARKLAGLIADSLQVTTRGEVLGTIQRCSSAFIGTRDSREAEALGYAAGTWLKRTDPGGSTMFGINGNDAVTQFPLEKIAGQIKSVPPRWQTSSLDKLEDFYDWLEPLMA